MQIHLQSIRWSVRRIFSIYNSWSQLLIVSAAVQGVNFVTKINIRWEVQFALREAFVPAIKLIFVLNVGFNSPWKCVYGAIEDEKKVHMGNLCLMTCEKDFQSKNHQTCIQNERFLCNIFSLKRNCDYKRQEVWPKFSMATPPGCFSISPTKIMISLASLVFLSTNLYENMCQDTLNPDWLIKFLDE